MPLTSRGHGTPAALRHLLSRRGTNSAVTLSPRWWLLLIVTALVGGYVHWTITEVAAVGLRTVQARSDVTSLEDLARAGQPGHLVSVTEDLASHLGSAAGHANTVPLRALSRLPLIGQDVRAARVSITGVAEIARAAPASARAAIDVLHTSAGHSPGQLALSASRSLSPALARTCTAVTTAADHASRVPTAGRLPFVSTQVGRVNRIVAEAAARCTGAEDVLKVLPSVLGTDGRRTYLLTFQNLAEARPTGGIVGSWALVSADRGTLNLEATGSDDDWSVWVNHVADLGSDAVDLYGSDPRRTQNVNLSPNFPYAGYLLSKVWQDQGHPAVDGVISVDPVALSYLLEATGPVRVDDQKPLTADDAVTQLTNTIYRDIGGSSKERLGYLGRVTGQVFAKLSAPSTDQGRLAAALVRGARQRHVMAWGPAGSDLGALAAAARIDGALPSPTTDTVGVYTTNIDGSKMDFYARVTIETRPCGQSPCVTVDLGNTAPASVTPYVGNQLPGATATTRHTAVSLYLPPSRGVERLTVDGRTGTLDTGRELGWTVVRTTVDVPRDSTVRLQFVLSGDPSEVRHVLTQPAISPVLVR